MTPLQANISGTLLPELEGNSPTEKWEKCAEQFPWYPLPWLMLARAEDKSAVQKAALWFSDDQRLLWLLRAKPWQEDQWLVEQLNLSRAAENETDRLVVDKEEDTDIAETRPPAETDDEQDSAETILESPVETTETQTTESEQAKVIPEKVSDNKKPGISAAENDLDAEDAAHATIEALDEADAEVEQQINPGEAEASDSQEIAEDTKQEVAVRPESDSLISTAGSNTDTTLPAVSGTSVPAEQRAAELPELAEDQKDTTMSEPDLAVVKADDLSLKQAEPPSGALFEPLHAVDYFASQGIRLEQAAEPKDKLDRQVKSFTQWLKTMKRVVPKESDIVTDPVVEAHATASLSGKEINTETMAQVLEKQGKYQKAAEVYQKLLLLHPEKSAFFAARIEELKNK